jgi:RecA-family ATPase
MIERKILIGLITSTEYCKQIKSIWNPSLIESVVAKRMASWVWEYYDKYNKSPGKDIETIFYSKIKSSKFPKEIAEEIEQDILPSLSEEYEEEGIEIKPLLDETEKYFNEQHIKKYTERVQAFLAAGEIEEAEKEIQNFKPLSAVSDTLNKFILTVTQIRRRDRKKPTIILKPWLREGQIYIVYGPPGSGKTLLALSLAYMIGAREFDGPNCQIEKWQVKSPTGCLYIDGELGEVEMEERIKQFEWLGPQSKDHRIRILSLPEYQLETEDSFYLSNKINQRKILKWLESHPTYKLVILDSISTLFGLEDENNNSEWNNKVSPLLRSFRALGVACILLHHAGKDGKKGLRGASAMSAMANGVFRLSNHSLKDIDQGQAWFILGKDKQRIAGFSFSTFAMKYVQNDMKTETHWEISYNYT